MPGMYFIRSILALTRTKANGRFRNLMQAAGRDEEQIMDDTTPCEVIAASVAFGRPECEGGLPDEVTVVARRHLDNHEPEGWSLETAAHTRHQH